MLQFINMLLMAAIIVSGFRIYNLEYEIRGGERRIAELTAAIAEEEDFTRLLGAEQASLASPQRIEKLARQHLPELQSMKAQQVMGLADVAQVLQPQAGELAIGAPAEAVDDPIAKMLKELQ